MSKEIILAKGRIRISRAIDRNDKIYINDIYLDKGRNHNIIIASLLPENKALRLEGKTITLKAVIEDDK